MRKVVGVLLLLGLAPQLTEAAVVCVSVNSAGVPVGGNLGYSISYYGRYVAFQTWAENLDSPDVNGDPDVYILDRDSNINGIYDDTRNPILAGRALSGQPVDVYQSIVAAGPVLSSTGQFLLFSSGVWWQPNPFGCPTEGIHGTLMYTYLENLNTDGDDTIGEVGAVSYSNLGWES